MCEAQGLFIGRHTLVLDPKREQDVNLGENSSSDCERDTGWVEVCQLRKKKSEKNPRVLIPWDFPDRNPVGFQSFSGASDL